MSTKKLRLRGSGCLALLLAVLIPNAALSQTPNSSDKNYLKEMAGLYGSLAITDVKIPPGPFQATDAFKPTFSITNQTGRSLTVPLKPGLPVDKACILGQSIWTIRRVGGAPAKRETPLIFIGHMGPVLAQMVEPKATMAIPPPSEGQTIKWMELRTGDYEVIMDFGIPNGPKVKPVVRRFRVENSASATELAKGKAAAMKSSRQSFGDFAHDVFAATKPGVLTLSNLEVKAGAPLEATYVIERAAGREVPSPDAQNRQYALGHSFRLRKSSGPKGQPPIWSKELLLNWNSIDVLREKGTFSMVLSLETNRLTPGAYELSVEVLHVEGAGNAPKPQQLRFTVIK